METFIYEEKISPKICDGLIKLFNNTHDKKKGEVGYPAVVVAKRKKCTEAYYKPLPYHPYLKALEKVITNYKKKYKYCDWDQVKWSVTNPIKIQQYKPKEAFYAWHYENNGAPQMITRHLVFMTYLNTVTDKGETEFFYQKKKFKPIKGSTLIWPAAWSHTHRGFPSPTQVKTIITGWFNYA